MRSSGARERSLQIASQQQRVDRFPRVMRVVSIPPCDLNKPRALVEMQSRCISVLDLKKDRSDSEGCQAAQVVSQQASGNAAAAESGFYCHSKDFGFVGRHTRNDEASKMLADAGGMSVDAAIGQHRFDLLLAPTTPKRIRVQLFDDRSVAYCGFPDRWRTHRPE